MMPAAPLVGAVTTRPPEAFSSLTASAHSVTQSRARSGSTAGKSPVSVTRLRWRSAARRRTLSPPGSTPGVEQPCLMHSAITDQIRSSPDRTSASGLRAHSLASATSLTDSPWSRQSWSSSVPVRNGYGTGVGSGRKVGWPEPSSSSTNPPPIE